MIIFKHKNTFYYLYYQTPEWTKWKKTIDWINPSKRGGMAGFSKGWQDCSEGFPEGEVRGKSGKAALPAQGKACPSQLFYLDFHSI